MKRIILITVLLFSMSAMAGFCEVESSSVDYTGNVSLSFVNGDSFSGQLEKTSSQSVGRLSTFNYYALNGQSDYGYDVDIKASSGTSGQIKLGKVSVETIDCSFSTKSKKSNLSNRFDKMKNWTLGGR